MADSCEHGNEPRSYIKGGECITRNVDYKLLTDSVREIS
jgi:hypothetical protein